MEITVSLELAGWAAGSFCTSSTCFSQPYRSALRSALAGVILDTKYLVSETNVLDFTLVINVIFNIA